MVNMDKWEKVEYEDLKRGDKVLRINKHDDGTRAEVRGVLNYEGFNQWKSRDNFILVQAVSNTPSKLYRRKTKPFEIPKGMGAVMTATDDNGNTVTLIRVDVDGTPWRLMPSNWRSERQVAGMKDHKVLSEGVILE